MEMLSLFQRLRRVGHCSGRQAMGAMTHGLRYLLPAALAVSAHASPSAPASALPLTPCRLEHPTHLIAVDAECGTLSVPENPAQPQGREVRLQVARVPAINRRKRADPLFLLAGGPGMAATSFYTSVAAAFARIRRDRDIVLLDQRGTGASNGLYCDMNDDALWHATDADLARATEQCLQKLSAHAAVAFYTTSIAVQDLDRVRAALGYGAINLYGGSYGTRVAQHYVRRFPEHTRTVILDGVIPPQLAIGATLALDAERALMGIFERCKGEPSCAQRFGDPAASYHALRERLESGGQMVAVPDPTTGAPVHFEFTSLHLAAVLRLSSYTAEQAALLPLTLDAAERGKNLSPLASQFLLVNRSYEDVLAYGMHNSVVCTEDVPFYQVDAAARARLEKTYLGTSQLDGLTHICASWPRGPIDSDFHAPLHSTVPALLLSGEDDPVTPPAYALAAAGGFDNHISLVLSGMGHGQISAPCVEELMARFIERGTTKGLDTSCTKRAKPLAFFTSFAGPPP
jgi:pimeloyl-ACP methyl ester carboxylesterase